MIKNHLHSEIIKYGKTLQEFSKIMNISLPTLRKWCNFGQIPSNNLSDMADMFGCSTDYLLGRTQERVNHKHKPHVIVRYDDKDEIYISESAAE